MLTSVSAIYAVTCSSQTSQFIADPQSHPTTISIFVGSSARASLKTSGLATAGIPQHTVTKSRGASSSSFTGRRRARAGSQLCESATVVSHFEHSLRSNSPLPSLCSLCCESLSAVGAARPVYLGEEDRAEDI